MAHDRNKLVGLAKRLLAHNLNGTTDQADGIMVKPVADYIDNEVISSEVNKIFYDYPVPIALSLLQKAKMELLEHLSIFVSIGAHLFVLRVLEKNQNLTALIMVGCMTTQVI